MSEFTKGKWKAFYGEKFHGIHIAHADDEQGHDYGNGQIIAHVVRWYDGHSWANARLIAAAPEMFELLLSLSYRTSGMEKHEVSKIREILTLIEGKEITSHGYYKN